MSTLLDLFCDFQRSLTQIDGHPSIPADRGIHVPVLVSSLHSSEVQIIASIAFHGQFRHVEQKKARVVVLLPIVPKS